MATENVVILKELPNLIAFFNLKKVKEHIIFVMRPKRQKTVGKMHT